MKQLVVFFANSSDTHFDRTKNFPKLYVDGVLQGPDDVHYASGTVLEDAATTAPVVTPPAAAKEDKTEEPADSTATV